MKSTINMMKLSFSMLPGLGEKTEHSLWREGILDWDTFRSSEKVTGISPPRKRYLNALLTQVSNKQEEPGFLANFFPRNLHWRLYKHLKKNAVFLDIETNGLSRYSRITVIGIYRMNDDRMITLVRGFNLNQKNIHDALKDCGVMVTFNGASFDLPFIRRYYPFTVPDIPHFDLRFAARRLGMRGGLKAIERSLGISRDFEVENLAGEDALLYWKMWKKDGNRKALELLKKYNREDVMNLVPLAGIMFEGLKEKTLEVIGDRNCEEWGEMDGEGGVGRDNVD